MFDTEKSYNFNFLGRKEVLGGGPLIAKSFFRFQAAKRKYFVTIEHFSFEVDAIKYCDLKDKDNKNGYTKIYNDHDGFKVLATCLKIMHTLWKNNPKISFAFYAAHRPTEFQIKKDSRLRKLQEDEEYREKYIRSRFNVYEHAMINLFPPNVFWKAKDYKNCIYTLINKKAKRSAYRLNRIAKYLLRNHDIIFELGDVFKPPKNKKKEIRIG